MSTEMHLQEKLRKIEALFAGAGTFGERLAAEAALERVQTRLADLGRGDTRIETKLTVADPPAPSADALWRLVFALCRRVQLAGFIGGFGAVFGLGLLTGETTFTEKAVAFVVGVVGIRLYIHGHRRAAPPSRPGRDAGDGRP